MGPVRWATAESPPSEHTLNGRRRAKEPVLSMSCASQSLSLLAVQDQLDRLSCSDSRFAAIGVHSIVAAGTCASVSVATELSCSDGR